MFYKGQEIPFDAAHLQLVKSMPAPRNVFMVTPTYFDIVDAKNIYMEGQKINTAVAAKQWEQLKAIYINFLEEKRLSEVEIIEGLAGMEDMVFCANQSFPFINEDGSKVVVLSNMKHASRQKEVKRIGDFYKMKSYDVYEISQGKLEGNGDLIAHPDMRIVWAGHGFRSDISGIKAASEFIDAYFIPLQLVSEDFYHLDTCFMPLNSMEAMVCEDAFDQASLAKIRAVFDYVYTISKEEAKTFFSLNAQVIGQKNKDSVAIIQKGSKEVLSLLKRELYKIYEVDTGEFMKSGGSVFCMKMMYY